jgi:hypothetical protein
MLVLADEPGGRYLSYEAENVALRQGIRGPALKT